VTKYLTADQVIEFHNTLLKDFGGLSGIRDKNLLHPALEAPKASFSGRERKICVILIRILDICQIFELTYAFD
jgi:prophage maintenance system killer protein